jgi:hypothetical protein
MTEVDWHAASASLRMGGATFVILSAFGVPAAKSSSQWEEGAIV